MKMRKTWSSMGSVPDWALCLRVQCHKMAKEIKVLSPVHHLSSFLQCISNISCFVIKCLIVLLHFLNRDLWFNLQAHQSWLWLQPSSLCWIHFTGAWPKVTVMSHVPLITPRPVPLRSRLSPSTETDTCQFQHHLRGLKPPLSPPAKWG